MKKIIFILTLMFLSTQVSLAQTIKYELVSTDKNAAQNGNFGMFNLNFLINPTYEVKQSSNNFIIQDLFDFFIGLSIVLAVIIFMVGAFSGIFGESTIKSVQLKQSYMTNSIVGLMIILSTYLILNTINPDLLKLPFINDLSALGKIENKVQSKPSVTGSNGSSNTP